MSIAAMEWAYRQEVTPSAAKFVLVTLANYADGDGFCFPGQDTLAQMTGQDERSVRSHLAALESSGLIRREHRQRKNGSRKSDGIYLEIPIPTGKSDRKELRNQPENLTGRPTGKSDRKERQSNRKVLQGQPENSSALEPKAFEPKEELKALTPLTPQTSQPDPVQDLAPSALEAEKKIRPEIIKPTPRPESSGTRLAPVAKLGTFRPQPKPEPAQAQDGITQPESGNVPGGAALEPSGPRNGTHGAMFAALAKACYGSTDGMTRPVATETHTAARVLEQAGYTPEDIPKIAAWMQAREPWRATTTPKTITERAPAWRNDPSLVMPFNPHAPPRKPVQHRSHSTRADVAFDRLSREMGLDDPDEILETDPPQTLALPGGRK